MDELNESCKSGWAFRVGFGFKPGSGRVWAGIGPKIDKILGLIRA